MAAHAIENLESNAQELVSLYQKKTRQPVSVVEEWFCSGRDFWFTAEEAVAAGLADEVFDMPPAEEIERVRGVLKPGEDPKRELLFDLLNALGPIRTQDRAGLMRDLEVWAVRNIFAPQNFGVPLTPGVAGKPRE